MTENFDPLRLSTPMIKRRASAPPGPPIPKDVLKNYKEKASDLKTKIKPYVQKLHELTPEQRRAVFYKLTQGQIRIDLTGTGLRVFAVGEDTLLAMVRGENLDSLLKKIEDFENATPKKGHIKNEKIGFGITDFELGKPTDRLSESMLEQYEHLIELDSFIFEIELMANESHRGPQLRELQQILDDLQAAITLNGVIYEHEFSAGFARVVLRTSGSMFQKLVEDEYWQTRIIRFENRPEFETFTTSLKNFSLTSLGKIEAPSENSEVVCIVDSGVTSGNPFLKPVSREDQFTSFVEGNNNPFDEYNHGSGVASLAAYQELNISAGAVNRASAWIVSARILDENNEIETQLLSSVLEKVVEHYSELGVRIFNLSVCVRNKPWNEMTRRAAKRSTWVARKIDQLSKKFDVVFIISAGNLTLDAVNAFIADGADYPAYFQSEECKILDPSQAALAITVGSIVPSTTVLTARSTPIAEQYLPSPFTRVGPGILGEIKPELVDYGGNWVVFGDSDRVTSNAGTNLIMASNKLSPAIAHDAGTSFAAPKVSYKMAQILAELRALFREHISSSLLRAFLVNSSSIRRSSYPNDEIDQFAARFVSVGSLARILGYGTADLSKAVISDQYSAICYYQGVLSPDDVAFFKIPVPKELSRSTGKKRITVTAAFSPDVSQNGLREYLSARMQWRLFRGDATEGDVLAAMSKDVEADTEAEGTDALEEVSLLGNTEDEETASNTKELKAGRFKLRQRSKGTIQHDVFEWKQHKEEYSDNDYVLAVSLFKRWSSSPIPLAVVVRIEDVSLSVPIYSAIKVRLSQIRVQARV
ncbi:MAG: hypothetical protein DKT66_01090 [Candidatus Melainabacteria bacterium]|nr:MAG: hypothetical protein DKT66_01090 [Candidatus Melainabacteria bacterium]